jgi:hypothetical protein
MQVVSQASVSAHQDSGLYSIKTMMMGMFESFQNFQNAMAVTFMEQSKRHVVMMEQWWKDMEFLLERQRQDMAMRMDQQHMDIDAFIERSMSSVISQVP